MRSARRSARVVRRRVSSRARKNPVHEVRRQPTRLAGWRCGSGFVYHVGDCSTWHWKCQRPAPDFEARCWAPQFTDTAGCCARATTGHAAALPSPVMNCSGPIAWRVPRERGADDANYSASPLLSAVTSRKLGGQRSGGWWVDLTIIHRHPLQSTAGDRGW